MKNAFDELEQLDMALRTVKRLRRRYDAVRPQFAGGDRVSFSTAGGKRLHGFLIEVKDGRATVQVDGHEHYWRMSVVQLRKQEERAKPASAQILSFPVTECSADDGGQKQRR